MTAKTAAKGEAVDEILAKHPELSKAEAQWMAGQTQAPYEVLCDLGEKDRGESL